MKQSRLWLLALMSVLAMLVTASVAAAEGDEAHLSGSWELGMGAVTTKDNAARVNEFASVHKDDGVALAPKLDLEFEKGSFLLEVESEVNGARDQQHSLELDAGRIFKLGSEFSVLQHWKDHETLDQMGATAREDTGGAQPSVTTDAIFADLADLGVTSVGGLTLDYDAAEAYAQEVANDYIVTRKEWKNEAELTLPQLPNVTFKAGIRIETREGMEQAIGLSKCDGCHVSAVGKNIDEITEEYTFGATGKFGILTVDYEYLTRYFDEDSTTPTRYYEDAQNASAADQLIYEAGDFEFNRTPDSEKETHMIKARVDLPRNTSITASYVKSEVDSSKSETQTEYELLDGDTLTTEYESFGAKLATKFNKMISLSLRGSYYEIEADDNEIYYQAREDSARYNEDPALSLLPFDTTDEYVSAEEREVTEIGTDVVIRLAKATTLRLGYEYEEVERVEEELGETETHSFKAALKTRINNQLSGRISYTYQDIDDPFGGDDATGIAQGIGTEDPLGSGLWYLDTADYFSIENNSATTVWYWNSVYPNRTMDATNQPDTVHETKLSTTWAPSANMAATLFARVRYEENDDVEYEQTTYVPGISFWYAPSDKLNLTMSYTFNNQDTENRACVGWYHG
ncbi:MAG: hypothetical protein C0620_06155 [Desulfuromonas sp.]|nr:MAG: hypothetical protein C0620_06155 [Desulfuromonas sp.]